MPVIEASADDASYFDYDGGVGPYRRKKTLLIKHVKEVAGQIVKRWRPRRTIEVACALGFLVEALRDEGVEAWEEDLSDFAISQVRDDIKPFCSVGNILDITEKREHYDLAIGIEVLEHLLPEEGDHAIAKLCSLGDEVLFSSNSDAPHLDSTHQNVQPAKYWIEIFRRHGYDRNLIANVSFAAPHALLFRRRGALRITFVSSSSGKDDELKSICRPACRLQRGGILSL
jgi:hypothetical protein